MAEPRRGHGALRLTTAPWADRGAGGRSGQPVAARSVDGGVVRDLRGVHHLDDHCASTTTTHCIMDATQSTDQSAITPRSGERRGAPSTRSRTVGRSWLSQLLPAPALSLRIHVLPTEITPLGVAAPLSAGADERWLQALAAPPAAGVEIGLRHATLQHLERAASLLEPDEQLRIGIAEHRLTSDVRHCSGQVGAAVLDGSRFPSEWLDSDLPVFGRCCVDPRERNGLAEVDGQQVRCVIARPEQCKEVTHAKGGLRNPISRRIWCAARRVDRRPAPTGPLDHHHPHLSQQPDPLEDV